MFATLKTLMSGANARAEEQLKDAYAIELIEQKIREGAQSLQSAKLTLASLIQRQNSEQRVLDDVETRITDLTERAREALAAGRLDLGEAAAVSIADMENEREQRRETLRQLEQRIAHLRETLAKTNRRLIDLKQGAMTARATRREQALQKRLNRHLGGTTALDDAEALIAQVLQKDDPFEQSEILRDIDSDLDHSGLAQRLAEHGFGPADHSTAAAVLARLKQNA